MLYWLLVLFIFSLSWPVAPFSFAQNKTQKQLLLKTEDLKKLKQSYENLNPDNFSTTIEEQVCPYLSKLTKKKTSLENELKTESFKKIIKIYEQILDYTPDHNYLYCLYRYVKYPIPNEVDNLLKQELSSQKYELLLNKIKSCHIEETQGNGDSVRLKPKKKLKNFFKKSNQTPLSIRTKAQRQKPIHFLPFKEYKVLPLELKKQYSDKIRIAYLDLDKTILRNTPAIAKKRKSIFTFPDFLLPFAFASLQKLCMIGGVVRNTVYSNRLGRYVCPTTGRHCRNDKSTFQCGSVFNNHCIQRTPIRNLSKRCYEASQKDPIGDLNYKDVISKFDIYNNYCVRRRIKGRTACDLFRQKINDSLSEIRQLRTAESQTSTPPSTSPRPRQKPTPPSTSPRPRQKPTPSKDTQTEATVACTNCDRASENHSLENIKQVVQTAPKELKIEKSMSLFLAQSAAQIGNCDCEGNDRCTRGCNPDGEHPPQTRCKRDRGTNGKCMRHVTGALMNTIHQFFNSICEQHNLEYDRKKCEQSKDQSLCNQSLIFPSALCALNLDGQNRLSNIRSSSVKRQCRAWNNHNNKILHVNIISPDGTIKTEPLFKQISIPRNIEELPAGAIVISNSNSIHGHIEIKTNKRNCGSRKNDACFCSDFCDSRKNGYPPSIKPQIAFQVNPKIEQYFRENI